jgi:hypothetical protein
MVAARRYPQRPPQVAREAWSRQAFPGSFKGRSEITRPLLGGATPAMRGVGASGILQRESFQDSWVLGSDGPTEVTTTYLPIAGSENMSINGVVQDNKKADPDWSREPLSMNVSLLNGPPVAVSGDIAYMQYDYYAGIPHPPTGPIPGLIYTDAGHGGFFARFNDPNLPATDNDMIAGDLVLVMIACGASTPPETTGTGIVELGSASQSSGFGIIKLFSYFWDGVEAFDFLGQNNVNICVAVLRGASGVEDATLSVNNPSTSSPGPTATASAPAFAIHMVSYAGASQTMSAAPGGVTEHSRRSSGAVTYNTAVASEERDAGATASRVWTVPSTTGGAEWGQAVILVGGL